MAEKKDAPKIKVGEKEYAPDELANLYKQTETNRAELEKKLGEQGNELGETRKKIQESLDRIAELEASKEEVPESAEEDIFADPTAKMKKEIERQLKEQRNEFAKKTLSVNAKLMELDFRVKHPDLTKEETKEIAKKIESDPSLYASPAGMAVALKEIRSPQKEAELRKQIEEETRRKILEEAGIPFTEGATSSLKEAASEEPDEHKAIKKGIAEAGKGLTPFGE